MVFTPSTLHKGTACPEGEKCTLINCIYGHDSTFQRKDGLDQPAARAPKTAETAHTNVGSHINLVHHSLADTPPGKINETRVDAVGIKGPAAKPLSVAGSKLPVAAQSPKPPTLPAKLPESLSKATYPPLTQSTPSQPSPALSSTSHGARHGASHSEGSNATPKSESEKKETLNPRLIPNDPAGHSTRKLLLTHIYPEMVRLNELAIHSNKSMDTEFRSFSEQELIKLALDREERVARDQPKVYGNIMKSYLAQCKKMKLDDWVKHVNSLYENNKLMSWTREEKPISTGLDLKEEFLILPHLVADQKTLTPFGYIPTPPTEAQAVEAAAAVVSSRNYEKCERCGATFQVYPERNSDGLVTSHGPCMYHREKKQYPQKTKGDHYTGPQAPYYPCCNEQLGSVGCTIHVFHVFKASNPARLAAVLPFITTPDNETPAKDKKGRQVEAVAFDCEMGYTVYGLELIRATAVAWPGGEELLDVLVRPLGTVIDLNSTYSGVWPEYFARAVPYNEWHSISATGPTTANGASSSLPVVMNPQHARELLCSFLTPSTPLIGHAIENDLNAIRLCHPTIVDTVLLYSHPKGLPMRFGLKALTSRHLGRNIQSGGDRGHDSLEDARATGDLVRCKVGEAWKLLRAKGWKIDDGVLIAPPGSSEAQRPALIGADDAKAHVAQVLQNAAVAGTKRSKNSEATHSGELPTPPSTSMADYVKRAKEGENN